MKFFQGLVAFAKRRGNLIRASKIMGILNKESLQKQWRRINKSNWKARGSSIVKVKVFTADSGVTKFKTKGGVFQAISEVIGERFQSALVTLCH